MSLPNPSVRAQAVVDEKGFPQFKFSCHENPFWLYESYCRNPECDCQSGILRFVEVSSNGKPVDHGVDFSFVLNFTDWRAKISASNQVAPKQKLDAILNEFALGLTSELKERFQNHYRETKRKAKRAAQFEISKAEIKSGKQRGYGEVFGEPGSFFSLEFDHENQKYLIADQYCLNPGCDCQRTSVTFSTYDPQTHSAKDVFVILLDFKGRYKIEFSKYPKRRLDEIVSAWLQSLPEAPDVFAYRYKQMKEVGSQIMERKRKRRVVRKAPIIGQIGRNDPCSCGSGKKFKKCCGK